MGISRPSLREAIKVLQTIGVIETRQGSGTFVGNLSLDPVADGMTFQILLASQQSDTPPQELLDLIEIIETRQIRKVTGKHTAAQIERMRALNDEIATMREDSALANERDLALHLLFYQPLGSQVADEFVRLFWRISTLPIATEASRDQEERLQDHTAIIDALEHNDPESAAAATTTHIRRLARAIEKNYNPATLRERALQGQLVS